jgi:mono/diheme cytochrome c family protein
MNNRKASVTLLGAALLLVTMTAPGQTQEHDRARAQAQTRTQPQGQENTRNRGEALYAQHCAACHSAQTQWRGKKAAVDAATLRIQVQRWQTTAGQNWTRPDIEEVASYMNRHFYRFRVEVERR